MELLNARQVGVKKAPFWKYMSLCEVISTSILRAVLRLCWTSGKGPNETNLFDII